MLFLGSVTWTDPVKLLQSNKKIFQVSLPYLIRGCFTNHAIINIRNCPLGHGNKLLLNIWELSDDTCISLKSMIPWSDIHWFPLPKLHIILENFHCSGYPGLLWQWNHWSLLIPTVLSNTIKEVTALQIIIYPQNHWLVATVLHTTKEFTPYSDNLLEQEIVKRWFYKHKTHSSP